MYRHLLDIGRIFHVVDCSKVLLDRPRRHESLQEGDRPGFVIRPTRARTSEGLVAGHSTRALVASRFQYNSLCTGQFQVGD
jgi:hypothetical protein